MMEMFHINRSLGWMGECTCQNQMDGTYIRGIYFTVYNIF